MECCIITITGIETGSAFGGEDGALRERELDDTLRGIMGRGAPAVFIFREKSGSFGEDILCEVIVAII